jgi:hypothetical protein
LHELRTACLDVLKHMRQVWDDGGDVVLVGSGRSRETFTSGAVGTFAGFGVPLTTTMPGRSKAPTTTQGMMPLSLTVGAWLMQQVGTWDAEQTRATTQTGTVRGESVPGEWSPAEAVALGRDLAASADRVAIVAMGDGSSALSVSAPGYVVAGAREWQDSVQQALTKVDTATLAAVDPAVAARFGAAGRVPWQVLAGAVGSGEGWQGELAASDERYGVGYLAVRWFHRGSAP